MARQFFVRLILSAVLLGILLPTALAASASFMKGFSSSGYDAAAVQELVAVGATHVRRYIMWSGVEHTLHALQTNLTLAALKADPQTTIYDWGDTLNWAYGDDQISTTLAHNITPIVELSEGTHFGLPRYNGTYADPSVIGIPLYLAYQYRFCRAAVHRYKARGVRLYQIENELNEAFLSGFAGQRLVSLVWGNWTFLTELLSTLRDAVKDEDASALVTMNFHTDVPDVVHRTLHLPGFYLDAVANWSTMLDLIALDAYPNMFVAAPVGGANVSARVAATMTLLTQLGEPWKPVFVMETGYPVNADNTTAPPAVFDFSRSNQAAFAADVVAAVHAVGGAGLLYFKFVASAGMQPPPGGYSTEDASFFAAIKHFLWTNDVTAFVDWLLAPGSINEVLTRASFFMGQPDNNGWGTFENDGTPRPVVAALQHAFANATNTAIRQHSDLPATEGVQRRS